MRDSIIFSDLNDDEDGFLITPLLDIIFLILVFFALNLSYQSYRDLNVTVPDTENIKSRPENMDFIVIEVTGSGGIILENNKVTLSVLDEEIEKLRDGGKDFNVYIAGDDKSSYKTVMSLLDHLSSYGLSSIHLISKEE